MKTFYLIHDLINQRPATLELTPENDDDQKTLEKILSDRPQRQIGFGRDSSGRIAHMELRVGGFDK